MKKIFVILFLIMTISVPADAELVRSHMIIRLIWVKVYPSAFEESNETNFVGFVHINNLTAYGLVWQNEFPGHQLNITLNETTNSGDLVLLTVVNYNETINYLGNISIRLVDSQNNSKLVSGKISFPNPTDDVLVQGNDCQSFRQGKEKACTQTYEFEYFEVRIRSEMILWSTTANQTPFPTFSVLLGIIVLTKMGSKKQHRYL